MFRISNKVPLTNQPCHEIPLQSFEFMHEQEHDLQVKENTTNQAQKSGTNKIDKRLDEIEGGDANKYGTIFFK